MRRNTSLHCGNLRSFTLSKLPQVILARLVLLAFSYGYKMWRNTSSNCGNPQSFTLSKILWVFLVLLVLLAFSYGYKNVV